MIPLRILVAEDDAVVAEDLRRTLEGMGHEVAAVVHDGEAAAQEARARAVELALLDVRMPGRFDGIEAGRRMSRELDIPVVFVTAHADDETVHRAWQCDPMGYLVKPVDARQLRTVIHFAAQRHARERSLRERVRSARRAEAESKRSERRYRALFRESPACALLTVLDGGRIRDMNQRFHETFGFRPEEAIGRTTDELRLWPLENDRKELGARLEADGGIEGLRVACQTRDGQTLTMEASVERLTLDGEDVLLVHAIDVSARAALEAEMEQLALYDGLSGLPNRNLFRDRLHQALERGRRAGREVAVLFIDLDRFKIVNDTLGHAAGDEVLKVAADRLRSCFRDEDTVARLGGDEFAVVLVRNPGGAEAAAVRVQDALAPALQVSGTEVHLGASIGIALARGGAVSAEDLMRLSDAAMYTAKGAGGGSHRVFDTALTLEPTERLERERDLERALHTDELVLFFHPLVALDNGRIVGAEALLRWEHPGLGLLAPADLVPVAEETGLVLPLGRRVMDMACRQLAEWDDLLPEDFFLSVNLSARHVGHADLVREVSTCVRSHGIGAERLIVEIPEGAALLAPQGLGEVRRLGVRVALDAYGGGSAPFARLKELEIDVLKLDRSLVAGLGSSWDDFVVVRSLLLCADGLGLDVVAKGIETREQLKTLVELGCPVGQGFLFGAPLTAHDLSRRLRDGGRHRV